MDWKECMKKDRLGKNFIGFVGLARICLETIGFKRIGLVGI